MKYTYNRSDLITQSPDGLWIPDGHRFDSEGYSSTGILEAKDKALQILDLFNDSGIKLPRSSGLHKLIDSTSDLADKWILNQDSSISGLDHARITHFQRITECILSLKDEPNRATYLRRLKSGTIDSTTSGQSTAKDTLWEIELLNTFRRRGIIAHLEDPPDIVIQSNEYDISIACKKLYSEAHVQSVMSNAVRQVNQRSNFGIIALNIDELTVAGKIYVASLPSQATTELDRQNRLFMHRYKYLLDKYLSTGRIIGALVSTGCVADTSASRISLNYVRMSTFWSPPNIPETHANCIRSLQDSMK